MTNLYAEHRQLRYHSQADRRDDDTARECGQRTVRLEFCQRYPRMRSDDRDGYERRGGEELHEETAEASGLPPGEALGREADEARVRDVEEDR